MAHASNVSSLVLGKASGRLLATGGDDCRVNLWSINKPNCIMVSFGRQVGLGRGGWAGQGWGLGAGSFAGTQHISAFPSCLLRKVQDNPDGWDSDLSSGMGVGGRSPGHGTEPWGACVRRLK